MKIGTFQADNQGAIHGKIHGLGIGVTSVALVPEKSRDGKPYFKIIADPVGESYEIGAAFEKSKNDKAYYSVSLDTPVFKTPVNAALFADEKSVGTYNLVWNRNEYTAPQAEANVEAGQVATRRFIGANSGATP